MGKIPPTISVQFVLPNLEMLQRSSGIEWDFQCHCNYFLIKCQHPIKKIRVNDFLYFSINIINWKRRSKRLRIQEHIYLTFHWTNWSCDLDSHINLKQIQSQDSSVAFGCAIRLLHICSIHKQWYSLGLHYFIIKWSSDKYSNAPVYL